MKSRKNQLKIENKERKVPKNGENRIFYQKFVWTTHLLTFCFNYVTIRLDNVDLKGLICI